MYSKQEVKKTRELFYTSFGKYMGKNKSIHGKHIKWVNYPTHVRHIYVRLFSNSKLAKIYIELQHKDDEIRSLYFEQFKQLKSAFENCVGSWIWIEYAQNELNQSSSRIEKEIQNVNIFDKNTWSVIFHFFEENLIKFDAFWIDFKDIFKQLDD